MAPGAPQGKKRRPLGAKLPWVFLLQVLIRNIGDLTWACKAHGCSNRSNIEESYSLLELGACAASDVIGEMETVIYGEIVQMMKDRIIPIFRCLVVKIVV